MKKWMRFGELLDPREYVKRKDTIVQSLGLVENLKLLNCTAANLNESTEELNRAFLECLQIEIKNSTIKRDIIDYIYVLRYYNSIACKSGNKTLKISEIKKMSKYIECAERVLIDKAYEEKIFATLAKDYKLNDMIVKKIFDTNMIELEDVTIGVRKEENTLMAEFYDVANLEQTFEIDITEYENIQVKMNRKTKLFI